MFYLYCFVPYYCSYIFYCVSSPVVRAFCIMTAVFLLTLVLLFLLFCSFSFIVITSSMFRLFGLSGFMFYEGRRHCFQVDRPSVCVCLILVNVMSHFGGQRSKVKVRLASQNTFIWHNLTQMSIRIKLSGNILYPKGQRSTSLWHHNVLQIHLSSVFLVNVYLKVRKS